MGCGGNARDAFPRLLAGSQGAKEDHRLLIDFFLADGIHKIGDVYTFLPLYFQQAKSNNNIGLSLAFEVLVGLVHLRKKERRQFVEEINLSDLAAFAVKVKSGHMFRLVPQRAGDSALALRVANYDWIKKS